MLKLVFWIVILALALSFFGISIQAIVNSPAGQANFNYLYDLAITGWQWLIGAFLGLIELIKGLWA